MHQRIGCSGKLVLAAVVVIILLAISSVVVLGRGLSSERLATPDQLEIIYTYEDGIGSSLYLVINGGKGQKHRFNVSQVPVARVYDVAGGESEWAEVKYLWFGKNGLDRVVLHLWRSKRPGMMTTATAMVMPVLAATSTPTATGTVTAGPGY